LTSLDAILIEATKYNGSISSKKYIYNVSITKCGMCVSEMSGYGKLLKCDNYIVAERKRVWQAF